MRIPLPGALKNAASMLRMIGQQQKVDDLVNSMNRAAESAVPEARPLLLNAVHAMSVEDAVNIVRGSETSVTDFFAVKTRAPLGEKFLPIVTAETQKVSLAAKYNAVASKGSSLGLIRPEDANVEQYVTRKALDGLFFMIGQEEKKIRADPVGTGSAILKAVFGGHEPAARAQAVRDSSKISADGSDCITASRPMRAPLSGLLVDSCSALPSGATSMNTNDGISAAMPERSFWKRSPASTDS